MKCPMLNISNGRVMLTMGSIEGSQAFISCNRYYKWTGSNSTVCQADGTWSGTIGRCGKLL